MEEVKEASCQADDAATDLGDKDDAEFVVADLIQEISSDLYIWAIIVDQVRTCCQIKCDLTHLQLDAKIGDFQLWDETSEDDGNISAKFSYHFEAESLFEALQVIQVGEFSVCYI